MKELFFLKIKTPSTDETQDLSNITNPCHAISHPCPSGDLILELTQTHEAIQELITLLGKYKNLEIVRGEEVGIAID